jgi:hypothetical protein
VLAGFAAAVLCCHGQATATPFQNLDFESAFESSVVPSTPTLVPASEALPDWTNNNYDPGYVFYDSMSLGSVAITIHDGLHIGGGDFYPIQGQYTVLLQGQWGGTPAAYISQVGVIPATANSLLFMSDLDGNDLTVSLNGTVIPMSVYSVGSTVNPNYGPIITYIGDIRAFSGQQNVTMQFTTTTNNLDNFADLDNIQFSATVVPEPSSLMLVAIGLLLLAGYSCHRRNDATKIR